MTTVFRSDSLYRRSLGSYVLTTSLVLGALMTVTTGCRFGNRVVRGDTADTDPVSGFYGTAPQSLKFCASHAETHCADVATNMVPTLIAAQMSDPVAFIVQDLQMGDAVLTAYNGGRTALPIWLGSDNTTLYFVGSFSPQSLWRDSKCMSKLYLEEEGLIIPGETRPVPGSSRMTTGRISLRIRVTEIFESAIDGVCQSTLQAMSNCYQDVSQCGGVDASANQTLQTEVQGIFEPYIQANAMSPTDIPNMTNIAYEIQYQ